MAKKDKKTDITDKKGVKRTLRQKAMRQMKRLAYFFKYGIWKDDFHTLREARRKPWIVRTTRVVVYTIKGVSEHETFVTAAAMTFFTIIAIFPIGGLVYAVLRGFGLEVILTEQLFLRFPDYTQFISMLMEAIREMLNSTRGIWFMVVSIFFIGWVSVRLFGNLENAFNRIWEVNKKRPFARKFASYMIAVILIPVLVIIFMFFARVTRSVISAYVPLPSNLVFALITFGMLWLLFSALFKFIPYTKVRFKFAMSASFLTVIAFMVFQWIYMYIQSGVNAYNIVYGGLASIPLFLLWVQTSWIIILMGAEVSFSFQNIDSYMQDRNSRDLSMDNRRKITLATMILISRHYIKNEVMVTSEDVAKELRLPLRLVRSTIFNLQKAGLIVAVNSPEDDKVSMYMPARDVHELTLYGVLATVEQSGSSIDGRSPIKEIRYASKMLEDIKYKAIHSEENLKLIDVINHESGDNR